MAWFGLRRRFPAQKQTIRNDGPGALEIMVEMIPNRYVLQPGDEMILRADAPATNEAFTIYTYEGGLQVYAAMDVEPAVWINGKRAEPDWVTPGPNAEAPSDIR